MGLDEHGKGSSPGQPFGNLQVYALRERGTGTIVFVGRRIRPDGDDTVGLDPDAVKALHNSPERADDLEFVILADDIDDPSEAILVENAVVSAYLAARLTPARSAPVNAVHSDRTGAARQANGTDRRAVDAAGVPGRDFLDGEHRQRLEELILRQHREIAELNEALDRVRALRDLQQWADGAGHVRVADLDRALGSTG